MTNYIKGSIDGQPIEVLKETTILAAAQSRGINIPTLCHHEGLPQDGNCRLCLVELKGRLVTACFYPLRENGFEIQTASPWVMEARAFVLQLLLDRCPTSPRLEALATEYGLTADPRFKGDDDLCIRCGRCVRACEINGPAAVSLTGRGQNRQVSGPFFQAPEACVGCLACALICPTGKISYSENKDHRSIWGRKFDLVPCPACGRAVGTPEQIKLSRRDHPKTDVLCESCRRAALAQSIKQSFPE